MVHDVALIVSDMHNGGTQRVYAILANAWAAKGKKVCLITQADPETDFHALDSRITRIVCGGLGNSAGFLSAIGNNMARILRLRSAIRQAEAPVAVAAIAPMAILSVIAGWGLATRIIVAERNDPARQSYGPVWDRLRRLVYPRAFLVTANSKGALVSLQTMVPNRKLRYLPNPLNPVALPQSGEGRQKTILNVARLYRHKAQRELLEAFAMLVKDHTDWRLAIAGGGPEKDNLAQLAFDLNISERVDFLGVVEDLAPVYAQASIFVLPSRYEGTPNALLEAMSSGLAPIVSDGSPGPLEIIAEGEAGLSFPVDDVKALADAMRRLINDEKERARLALAAQESVRPFALENSLEVWNDVLGLEAAGIGVA